MDIVRINGRDLLTPPRGRTHDDDDIRVFPRDLSVKAMAIADEAEKMLVALRALMRENRVSEKEFLSALPPEWNADIRTVD